MRHFLEIHGVFTLGCDAVRRPPRLCDLLLGPGGEPLHFGAGGVQPSFLLQQQVLAGTRLPQGLHSGQQRRVRLGALHLQRSNKSLLGGARISLPYTRFLQRGHF